MKNIHLVPQAVQDIVLSIKTSPVHMRAMQIGRLEAIQEYVTKELETIKKNKVA